MSDEIQVLNAAAQKAIIGCLSEKLRANYVLPDIADEIAARLSGYLEAGEYSGTTESELFALALTLNLQEVNHDEHLWVRWHAEPLPDFEGQLRLDKEWEEQRKRQAAQENFGFHKLESLRGNICCLDLRYLYRAAWAAETAAAAMDFLAGMNALILDLRQCTGGYPDMIALLCSYLFDGPPIHLSSIYWRDEDKTQEFWTLPDLPGKRFVDKPVYLLVSRATFSAGEGLAAILQARRRAVVIGEKTDGGAHPGASYRIHPHFEAFIPIGRTFDPHTGRDLEGIGVLPDLCLPQEQAYLAAWHMALKEMLSGAVGPAANPDQGSLAEAREALRELDSKYRFCPRCGCQNESNISKCKYCGEKVPGAGG